MRINSLNIYTTKIGLTVEMSDLQVIGSSLCFVKAKKKISIVNNDGIKTTGLAMSRIGITGLNLCCKGATKKGSTVDNNGVGTISLGMYALEEIGSNLRCDKHLQCCQNTIKDLPARFCVKSSILF